MKDENRPSRRTVLSGAATLTAGLEVLAYARPARASAVAAERHAQIDAAVREVDATTRAFDDAIANLEASLPRLHPSLVWRRNWWLPHDLCAIERRFDGQVVNRTSFRGHPNARYLASPQQIEAEIRHPRHRGRKGWRRFLRRTLKRARRYQAMLARAEQPAIEAEVPMMKARQRLEALAEEIFAKPSTNEADVVIKARVLAAFSGIRNETRRRCQAGAYGAQLANEILAMSGREVLGARNPRT